MPHWLMKSEPTTFSIQDLARAPGKRTAWEGVRNYQARNFMRAMKKGDLAFFYHSNCEPPGIAGICKIVKSAYPDPTQFDTKSRYYDPKSTMDNPRWSLVDIELVEVFEAILSLSAIKSNAKLATMALVQKGQRLSVQPVTEREWREVIAMAKP